MKNFSAPKPFIIYAVLTRIQLQIVSFFICFLPVASYSQSVELLMPYRIKIQGESDIRVSPDRKSVFRFNRVYSLDGGEDKYVDHIDVFSGAANRFNGAFLNVSVDGEFCAVHDNNIFQITTYNLLSQKEEAKLDFRRRIEKFSVKRFHFSSQKGRSIITGNVYMSKDKLLETRHYLWDYTNDSLSQVKNIPVNGWILGFISADEVIVSVEEKLMVINVETEQIYNIPLPEGQYMFRLDERNNMLIVEEHKNYAVINASVFKLKRNDTVYNLEKVIEANTVYDISKDGHFALVQDLGTGFIRLVDLETKESVTTDFNSGGYTFQELFFYNGEANRCFWINTVDNEDNSVVIRPLKVIKKSGSSMPEANVSAKINEWKKGYLGAASFLFPHIDRFILADYAKRNFHIYQLTGQKLLDSVSLSKEYDNMWLTPIDSSKILVQLHSAGVKKRNKLSDWLKIYDLNTRQFAETPQWDNIEEDYGDHQLIQYFPEHSRIVSVEAHYANREKYLKRPELIQTDKNTRFLGNLIREIDFETGKTLSTLPISPKEIVDYFFTLNGDLSWIKYQDDDDLFGGEIHWYDIKNQKARGKFWIYFNTVIPLNNNLVLLESPHENVVFDTEVQGKVKTYGDLSLGGSLSDERSILINEKRIGRWDKIHANAIEIIDYDRLDAPVNTLTFDGDVVGKYLDKIHNILYVLIFTKSDEEEYAYQLQKIDLDMNKNQGQIHQVSLTNKNDILEPKILRSDNPGEITVQYDDLSWRVIDLKTGRAIKSIKIPDSKNTGQLFETFLSSDQSELTLISRQILSFGVTVNGYTPPENLLLIQKWNTNSWELVSGDTMDIQENHQVFNFENLALDSENNLYFVEKSEDIWKINIKKRKFEKLTDKTMRPFSLEMIKNSQGEIMAYYFVDTKDQYILNLVHNNQVKKYKIPVFEPLMKNKDNFYWSETFPDPSDILGNIYKRFNIRNGEVTELKNNADAVINDEETFYAGWNSTFDGKYGFGVIDNSLSGIVTVYDTVKTPYGSMITQRSFDKAFILMEEADQSKRIDFKPILTTFTKDNNFFAMVVKGAPQIWIYNTGTGEKVIGFYGAGINDFLTVTPDHYYTGTLESVKKIRFLEKGQNLDVSTYDWWRNRPDIIVRRLGSGDSTFSETLRQAWEKRLSKANVTRSHPGSVELLPVCRIANENELSHFEKKAHVNIVLEATSEHEIIKMLYVFVNGTNVLKKDVAGAGKKTVTHSIDIALTSGLNNISIYCVDEAGLASPKINYSLFYEGEEEKETVYYVGLGVGNYNDSTYNLKYTIKDINDLDSAFKRRFTNTLKTYTFTNEKVNLQTINKIKELLSKVKANDKVIISLSGHGILDAKQNFYFATPETDFSNPTDKSISYDDIEKLLDGLPCRNKLLLIDACHSGETDRDGKAMIPGEGNLSGSVTGRPRGSIGQGTQTKIGLQNSFKVMQQIFSDFQTGNGTTIISAAGGEEYAFESEEWKNGVFTYSVLRGLADLKADENNDGVITISELQRYVSLHVQTLTNGKQQPTSRQYNHESDFRVW